MKKELQGLVEDPRVRKYQIRKRQAMMAYMDSG